jgi:hypothetical protein
LLPKTRAFGCKTQVFGKVCRLGLINYLILP